MLKYTLYIVVILIAAGLSIGAFHLWRVADKNKKEMAQYAAPPAEPLKSHGKVLVVYYSLSGNTKDIAQRIQKQSTADLYEIRLKQPFSPGASLYFNIKKQLRDGNYPELAGTLPDFSKYDLIIVGSPVWWYTLATPVLSFLQTADFAGKPVAVFTTQGSNPGTSFADFKKAAQNADVISTMEFNNLSGKYETAVDNKIAHWLRLLFR